ncbi:sterol carrier protein 2b isoform X3 [Phyllopteryx taeniolatus]|uniref:sterol carrier protein 2b isoform X3 n=1 Tax=Phyllopteryx taeniolatus TaxID=161469 RepID=UPI002AD592D7|nr:sterol carrier protein 2b isoform X3 [Phyllopteryx taeniolatus]
MPERHTPRIVAARSSASDNLEGFKAHAVFQEINKKLQQVRRWKRSKVVPRLLQGSKVRAMFAQDGDAFVKKIGGVFAFKVKDGPGGKEATWFVDVKNGSGCVHNDTAKKADCTIAMSDSDLLALMTGKMNPQTKSSF